MFKISRQEIEVEGKKSNGWQELRYYSEKDVKLLELQPIK